jgi:hypothetical protein
VKEVETKDIAAASLLPTVRTTLGAIPANLEATRLEPRPIFLVEILSIQAIEKKC